MRYLIALIAFCASTAAFAAAPSISCAPSQTAVTENMGVFMDCTATTDTDYNETSAFAYLNLLFRHTIVATSGGSTAKTWAYGTRVGEKQSYQEGPLAAYVFETAGTYEWTITATDGTSTSRTTKTITVSAADTTFLTTATECFSNGSTFTGCPSDATQRSTRNDFDADLTLCIGTTKRCLFERGGTWNASTTTTITADGPWQIGAYGTGAKPIIEVNYDGTLIAIGGAAGIDKFAIYDLNIDCNSNASCIAVKPNVYIKELTLLRLDRTLGSMLLSIDSNILDALNRTASTTVSGTEASGQTVITVASATGIADGNAISIRLGAANDGDYHVTTVSGTPAGNDVTIAVALPASSTNNAVETWALPFSPAHSFPDQIFVADSTMNCHAGSLGNGISGVFASATRLALIGNYVDTCATGEHGFRTMHTDLIVASNNTIDLGDATNAGMTMRSLYYGGTPTKAANTYSQYGVFSQNKLIDAESCGGVGATNGNTDGRWQFAIWEKNACIGSANTIVGLSGGGFRSAYRNNIFDFSAQTDGARDIAIVIEKGASLTAPDLDYNLIHNNTCYRSTANEATKFVCVRGGNGATSTNVADNNLMYAPLQSNLAVVDVSGTGALTEGANNTSDANAVSQNPYATPPSSSSFVSYAPTAASAAATGGVVLFPATGLFGDFFRCHDKTSAVRIGAIVPRASAICVGAP